MPIYEYVCSACGKLNEAFQKLNDPAPEKCDGCEAKGTLTKALSRTSFVLKGGGWYSDLYGSVKKDSDSTAPSSSASSSGTSSGSGPAPASGGDGGGSKSSPKSSDASAPKSSDSSSGNSGGSTPAAAK